MDDLSSIRTVTWCLPRTGSHNLMRRLLNTYGDQLIAPGNLQEMFPDYHPLVGKSEHHEHTSQDVENGGAAFAIGKTWYKDGNVWRNVHKENWVYQEEMEHRLTLIETNQIQGPLVGKHISWWNRFLEDPLRGRCNNYTQRVHQAVASISDRAIVLWRQDAEQMIASQELLSWGFTASRGSIANEIPSHGDVIIRGQPADRRFDIFEYQANNFIETFMQGLEYLDRSRTVMISTEELDSTQDITWPDGFRMKLSNRGADKHRNTYTIEQGSGSVQSRPLNIIEQYTDHGQRLRKWASEIEARYDWSQLRASLGFSRGW